MTVLAIGGAAVGTVLASRIDCMLSRMCGASIAAICCFALVTPAWADQTILASDSSQVDCQASASDLTRISLVEDEFASVSKISTGNPSEDFSVVNEPVRGDIYLSVPEGYAKPELSFFATSKRGYVYKLVCRVSGDRAQQVFISNPAIAAQKETDTPIAPPAPGPQETAITLVQAMYTNSVADGYEMRQRTLRPVYVGALKVQMIAEYRGTDLTGKVLRIENTGPSTIKLDERNVAPASALAVSIADPDLGPGKATTAYLVSQNGR